MRYNLNIKKKIDMEKDFRLWEKNNYFYNQLKNYRNI